MLGTGDEKNKKKQNLFPEEAHKLPEKTFHYKNLIYWDLKKVNRR